MRPGRSSATGTPPATSRRASNSGAPTASPTSAIAHRASDLVAQSDDGTATAKIAAGLLADSATKIILRQAPDQVGAAISHFGLTAPEANIVGQLTRGRALWKIGGRTAVVHHVVGPTETRLVDTDSRMQPSSEAA